MVPKYSERRHRLNPVEVDPVMEAVGFRLRQLVEEKQDLRTAEILFRVYFRLREYVTSARARHAVKLRKEVSQVSLISYIIGGGASAAHASAEEEDA